MPRQLFLIQRFFLSVFAIYIVIGALSFIEYRQGAEVIYMSHHHSTVGNSFFIFCSALVEQWGMLILGLLLLIAGVRYFVVYAIDLLLLGVVVQSLKHFIFPDHYRPAVVIGSRLSLDYIQGVEILREFSFPSGHTATAFGVCFLLAIFIHRKWASVILLILAGLVGFSRVYLLQHFWVDVYFGSILGMAVTVCTYLISRSILYSNKAFWQYSLWEIVRKKKSS